MGLGFRVKKLSAFEQEEGRLPKNLAELVPRYVEAIPLDPFDHKPLRYRANEDKTWLFYSVGANAVDDGGAGRGDDEGRREALDVTNRVDLVFPSTEFYFFKLKKD